MLNFLLFFFFFLQLQRVTYVRDRYDDRDRRIIISRPRDDYYSSRSRDDYYSSRRGDGYRSSYY